MRVSHTVLEASSDAVPGDIIRRADRKESGQDLNQDFDVGCAPSSGLTHCVAMLLPVGGWL